MQRRERMALLWVALAQHLVSGAPYPGDARRRASQPPACTECSCPGSPIAITFAPAHRAAVEQSCGRAGARHPRLVEDHDRPREVAPP